MGYTIATVFLPRSYCPTHSGYSRVGFCLSTGLCTGASSTVAFLERKVPDFISPTRWPPNSPDLNPVDYSTWSVLQEKVYRSIIANVSELDMRLINERGRFVQSIVDAAIGQWRRRLSACVRRAGHTLSTKHKVSAILSCIVLHCIVLYSSIYMATLNSHRQTEALLVRS